MEIRITPFIANRFSTNINQPNRQQARFNQAPHFNIPSNYGSRKTGFTNSSPQISNQSQVPVFRSKTRSSIPVTGVNRTRIKRSIQPLLMSKSTLISNVQRPGLNEAKGISLYRQIETNKLFSAGTELLNRIDQKV